MLLSLFLSNLDLNACGVKYNEVWTTAPGKKWQKMLKTAWVTLA